MTSREFYRKYLSRYRIFIALKKIILFYYFKYPKFFGTLKFLFAQNVKFSLKEISRDCNNLIEYIHEDLESFDLSEPRFFGDAIEVNFCMEFPRIYCSELSHITIVGGVSLLFRNKFALYPDLFDLKKDLMPFEVHGIGTIDSKKNTVRIKIKYHKSQIYESAINMAGQCSANYAHWLIEYLPRLVVLKNHNRYKNIPILIDEWLHPNIVESIMFYFPDAKIIRIPLWQALKFKKIIYISQSGYIPYETRVPQLIYKPRASNYLLSKRLFESLRLNTHSSLGIRSCQGAKRIFLKRTGVGSSNGRFLRNENEIENLLAEFSFESVDVSSLSFLAQIQMFASADIIISPIGGAVANSIFCKKGAKFLILAYKYENADYYLFSNLMGILNLDYEYVIGSIAENQNEVHLSHKDYVVPVERLRSAVLQNI